MRQRSYSSFAEFEREEIRPNFKIGFSIDDLEEGFENEMLFDADADGDDFFEEKDHHGRR